MAVSLATQTNSPAAVAASSLRAAQPPSKLAKAAQEFEAILLTSWLEKMNQSFVGSEESQDAAHDTVSSLGTQAIASALAARGGIGIARMLLRQLHPTQPAAADARSSPAVEQNALTVQPSARGESRPGKD
ncbi:MAG: rod-binding protein [Candidatus Korobacteraceae bacterium]